MRTLHEKRNPHVMTISILQHWIRGADTTVYHLDSSQLPHRGAI